MKVKVDDVLIWGNDSCIQHNLRGTHRMMLKNQAYTMAGILGQSHKSLHYPNCPERKSNYLHQNIREIEIDKIWLKKDN